jgi:isopenicillin N synthase-like dioxygenase
MSVVLPPPEPMVDELERQGCLYAPLSRELEARLLDAQAAWRAFFLSEAKWSVPGDRARPAGYVPCALPEAHDLKESFYVQPNMALPPGLSRATWPLVRELGRLAERVAWRLSRSLGYEVVSHPRSGCLRAIHYPPLDGGPEAAMMRRLTDAGVLRSPPHTDLNTLTFLPPSTAPGLELLDPSGRWRAPKRERDHVVILTGQELVRRSDGRVRATVHRVRNPDAAEDGQGRLAFAYFVS